MPLADYPVKKQYFLVITCAVTAWITPLLLNYLFKPFANPKLIGISFAWSSKLLIYLLLGAFRFPSFKMIIRIDVLFSLLIYLMVFLGEWLFRDLPGVSFGFLGFIANRSIIVILLVIGHRHLPWRDN